MNKNLEIDKMLTLSTAHIEQSTAEFLDDPNREKLIVYNKSEYGWFIYLGSEELNKELNHIPQDLVEVIKFALNNECKWLCLDRDADIIDELTEYDW